MLDLAAKIVPEAEQERVRGAAAALRDDQRSLFARISPALELDAAAVGPPGAPAGDHDPVVRDLGRPRARAVLRLVRVLPAVRGRRDRAGRRSRSSTARSRTAAERLPAVAAMGFDVVYLPPIHPIGKINRKGRNNTLVARPEDVGSPWAIGSDEGGHDAIHPQLGTLEDFRAFIAAAHDTGLEVAMDLALQAAPDHPWVNEHPEWFTTRAGRHHRVRGEPAEEVPGHLPAQLRQRPARASARRSCASSCTGSRRASRSSGSTTRTPRR